MATDTITVYKKAQEIYQDIAKYIETKVEQKKLEEELRKKKKKTISQLFTLT